MSEHPFRDKAAIAGIGITELSKNSGVSTLTLALRAIMAAVEDAGLRREDIDGVACHQVQDSITASIVAQCLPTWHSCGWHRDAPKLSPTATRVTLSSLYSPNAHTGRARSPDSFLQAARRQASGAAA